MLYLVLSIFCSVTVGAIFKIARRYNPNITQVVGFNYAVALGLCYLTFSPDVSTVVTNAPWGIYLPLAVLLPGIFIIMALSVKYTGLVKTDAAQRLSLLISLLAAWLIFGETFNNNKIRGIIIAIPALLLILSKPADKASRGWIYPLLVLVGYGVIDILFKQIALYTTLPYTTSLFVVFGVSLSIMVLAMLYEIVFKRVILSFKNIIFGTLVGIFNFGNILFYLKAHKAFFDNPSTVFAAMNIGVIILGSLVGIVVFKEKLSARNYAGIFLALVAIIFITLSQIYS